MKKSEEEAKDEDNEEEKEEEIDPALIKEFPDKI